MTKQARLTAEQLAEWAEQVDYARGYVSDRIASPWAGAIIAVDAELMALRRRNAWLEGYLAASESDVNYYWPNDWGGAGNDGEPYPPWDEDVEWEKN